MAREGALGDLREEFEELAAHRSPGAARRDPSWRCALLSVLRAAGWCASY